MRSLCLSQLFLDHCCTAAQILAASSETDCRWLVRSLTRRCKLSAAATCISRQCRLAVAFCCCLGLAAQITHRCTTSTMSTSENCATRRYYKAIHSKHFITGKRSETVSAAAICYMQHWTLQYSVRYSTMRSFGFVWDDIVCLSVCLFVTFVNVWQLPAVCNTATTQYYSQREQVCCITCR